MSESAVSPETLARMDETVTELAKYHVGPPMVTQQRSAAAKRIAAARARERERKTGQYVRIIADIPLEVAPALRSALEEERNAVGGRLEGHFSYAREQALTDAVRGLGVLAKAVNACIPAGDPYFDRDPEEEQR